MNRIFRFTCLVSVGLAVRSTVAGATFGFDEFPAVLPSGDSSPVPDGYAGLQWETFDLFDILNLPPEYFAFVGYPNSMVSSPNVAVSSWVNQDYSVTAGFSSPNSPFDLISAFLTATADEGVQINAQGFIGGTLLYNNVYTINTDHPYLINFNYFGVDKVHFIATGDYPWGKLFTMDDLTIVRPVPDSGGDNLTLLVVCFGFLVLHLSRRLKQNTGR